MAQSNSGILVHHSKVQFRWSQRTRKKLTAWSGLIWTNGPFWLLQMTKQSKSGMPLQWPSRRSSAMTLQHTRRFGTQLTSRFSAAALAIKPCASGICAQAETSSASMLTLMRYSQWTSTSMKTSSLLHPLTTLSKFGTLGLRLNRQLWCWQLTPCLLRKSNSALTMLIS